MKTKSAIRPCPICESTVAEVLHHQRFTLPESHPLPSSFDVVNCSGCGMIYADTAGTSEDYDRYYSDYSKYADQGTSTGGGGNPLDQARLEETANEIAKHFPDRTAKIVDIGCANGGLLNALKQLGYNHLVGVDPSKACVENTRVQSGIQAEQGWLLALPEVARSADVAIVSHVFEHVLDLRNALQCLKDILSPGGMIYIEVPDAERYVECIASPFQDFNIEHINHFEQASLENLFLTAGMTPVAKGNKTMQASASVPYPAIFGFFLKPGIDLVPPISSIRWNTNPKIRASIDLYIKKSREQMEGINSKIQKVLNQPLIVWGTGQLTLKLLAETSLGQANLFAFTDGNPVNHGKHLCGLEIIPPETLSDLPAHPIVIATLLHYSEIASRIRKMGLNNQIITLICGDTE